jgi:hypothetical protein
LTKDYAVLSAPGLDAHEPEYIRNQQQQTMEACRNHG